MGKLTPCHVGGTGTGKSYWYLVEVTRSGGKWMYKGERESPGELLLKNGTAQNKRLEVYQAQKALGIMSRPDGKMVDQMKELENKPMV
jgi:hypothetical protein